MDWLYRLRFALYLQAVRRLLLAMSVNVEDRPSHFRDTSWDILPAK
jgi:hypothetical protein